MDPSAGDAAGELMPAGVDPRAPPAQDDGALEWDAINALIEETGSDSLMLDSGQEAGQPDQGVADGAEAAQHMHVEVNEGMQVDPAPELPPMQPTSSSTAPVVQDEALGAAMQDLDITVQAPPPAAADGSQSGHLSSAAATPGVPFDQAVLLALGQTNPPFTAEPVTATNTGGGGIQVAAPMIGRGEAGRNAQRFNTGARAAASMTSIRFSVPTDEEDGASDEDEEGLLSPESRRLAFAAVKFPPPQKCRPTPSKHKQKLKAASGGRVAKPITTGTHSGKFQCDRCLKVSSASLCNCPSEHPGASHLTLSC